MFRVARVGPLPWRGLEPDGFASSLGGLLWVPV